MTVRSPSYNENCCGIDCPEEGTEEQPCWGDTFVVDEWDGDWVHGCEGHADMLRYPGEGKYEPEPFFVYGILIDENLDKDGESIKIDGVDIWHKASYAAWEDNLEAVGEVKEVRKITGITAPYYNSKLYSETDRELWERAGQKPFIKVRVAIDECMKDGAAVANLLRAGLQLFFGFQGKILQRKGSVIERCVLDNVKIRYRGAPNSFVSVGIGK